MLTQKPNRTLLSLFLLYSAFKKSFLPRKNGRYTESITIPTPNIPIFIRNTPSMILHKIIAANREKTISIIVLKLKLTFLLQCLHDLRSQKDDGMKSSQDLITSSLQYGHSRYLINLKFSLYASLVQKVQALFLCSKTQRRSQ